MKVDFIAGNVLVSSKQIADVVAVSRDVIGLGRWLTPSEIADALGITKSRSSLCMIGKAMRQVDGVVAKRVRNSPVFCLV